MQQGWRLVYFAGAVAPAVGGVGFSYAFRPASCIDFLLVSPAPPSNTSFQYLLLMVF